MDIIKYYIVGKNGKVIAGPFDTRRDAAEFLPPRTTMTIQRFLCQPIKLIIENKI